MQSYMPHKKLKIPKIVLYWLPDDENTETDGLINNLSENAEKDLNYNYNYDIWDIEKSYPVPYGWHAALVEHFSKWEPHFKEVLSEIWKSEDWK